MKPTAMLLAVLLGFLIFLPAAPAGAKGGYVGISVKYVEDPARHEGRMVIVLVYPDSPAAKAGLQVGDVVTRVNGVAFRFDDWTATVLGGGPFSWAEPGDSIELHVLRGGQRLDFGMVAVAPPPQTVEEKRLFLEGLRKQNGAEIVDRLARRGALVTVEISREEGAPLRASADGLTETEIEALSQHFTDRRLNALLSRARPGEIVRLQLGIHPGTDDPSITVVPP